MSRLFIPPADPTSLLNQLRGLRFRWHAAVLLRGVALTVAVPLAIAVAAGASDWLFAAPSLVRAFALVAAITAAGCLFIGVLLRPLRSARDDFSLARRLERTNPQLNDSLSSAIQFLDDAPAGGSRHLREATLRRALARSGDFEFRGIVPARSMWLALLLAALSVGGFVALKTVAPEVTERGTARLLGPFAGHRWTELRITTPTPDLTRMAKGEALEINIEVDGVLPDEVTVDLQLDGAEPTPRSLPTDEELVFRFEPSQIPRSFRFRARGHDADTGWRSIEVAPPPELVPIDGRPSPHIHVTPPGYTGDPAVELPGGTSTVEVLVGTQVRIRAQADRRITDAALALVSSDRLPLAGAAAFGGESFVPVPMLAAALADRPAEIDPSGGLLSWDFVPRLAGRYEMRFTDETGLTGRRSLDIRVMPDRSPVARIDRPNPAEDLSTALPGAELPFAGGATDPDYTLRSAWLEYRVGDGGPTRIPLYRAEPLAMGRPLLGVPHGFPVSPLPAPKTWRTEGVLDLTALARPDGSPLQPGDVLRLRLGADDFDDVTVMKTPGYSDEVVIEIVTRRELEDTLRQEMLRFRPELSRLLDQQKAARRNVREVRDRPEAEPAKAEDFEKLRLAEHDQRQVEARLATPRDGLRDTADRLRRAARANRLPDSPTLRRIEAVADEIDRLTREVVSPIAPLIAEGRRRQEQGTPPSDGIPEPLDRAEWQQRQAEEILQGMLDRLEPWSGAGEAAGQAQRLLRQQRELGDRTEELRGQLPSGQTPDELPPGQRAELRRAAGQQAELADRVGGLIDDLNRLATEKEKQIEADRDRLGELEAKGDPASRAEAAGLRESIGEQEREAAALRRAMNAAAEGNPAGQLKDASEQLGQNQLGAARTAQAVAAADLEKLIDSLREPAGEQPDRLMKKRESVANRLRDIADAQQDLQDRADGIGEMSPEDRQRLAEELAAQQEQLRRLTRDVARDLEEAGAQAAAAAAAAAERAMEQSQRRLEQGESPEGELDDAAEKIDQARQELDEQEQPGSELDRERAEELAKRLKALKERQEALIAERERVAKKAREEGQWSRVLLVSLNDLAVSQASLRDEVQALRKDKFDGAPVFGRMLQHAVDAMTRASERAETWKNDSLDFPTVDPELEEASEAGVDRAQRLAVRRFTQIIDALEQAAKKPENGEDGGGQPTPPMPPGGGAGNAGQPGTGLPPLAQLRALKALQEEVAERTAAFAEDHPDVEKLDEQAKEESEEIRKAQIEISEMFQDLRDGLAPMGGE